MGWIWNPNCVNTFRDCTDAPLRRKPLATFHSSARSVEVTVHGKTSVQACVDQATLEVLTAIEYGVAQ